MDNEPLLYDEISTNNKKYENCNNTQTNITKITNKNNKLKIFKKVKCDYLLVIILLIANVVFNIYIYVYISGLINKILYYENKIDEHEIEDYTIKFKKVIDYVCNDMIKCI